MTEQQLRMTDIVPDLFPTPLLWDCMKTCRHAHESPHNDHFPGTTIERCNYGSDQAEGRNGRYMVSKIVDNIWYCWCKYYEEARPTQ